MQSRGRLRRRVTAASNRSPTSRDLYMPSHFRSGSIINGQEELELATPERRLSVAEAVTAGVEEFCASRGQAVAGRAPASKPASVAITAPEASGRRRFISAFIPRKRSRASKPRRSIGRKSGSAEALSRALGAKNRLNLVSHRCRNSLQGSRRRSCKQPASGRSSRVGVTQISCSPILIDASADRHFNLDVAWEIDS